MEIITSQESQRRMASKERNMDRWDRNNRNNRENWESNKCK